MSNKFDNLDKKEIILGVLYFIAFVVFVLSCLIGCNMDHIDKWMIEQPKEVHDTIEIHDTITTTQLINEKYLRVDINGTIHTSSLCGELTNTTQPPTKEFIDTSKITSSMFSSYCTECIRAEEYEEITALCKRNEQNK